MHEDGLTLAKVRRDPVLSFWEPMEVEWIPETINRQACDFPIFHPVVRCMSQRASDGLGALFSSGVEFLPLVGLGGDYVGFHCINWLDVADLSRVDELKFSINSTMFVPSIRATEAAGHDVFGDFRLITKIFVSDKARQSIVKSGFKGLEFHKVVLT